MGQKSMKPALVVLYSARDEFLEKWGVALKELVGDEARDFVFDVKQRMTLMALRQQAKGENK